jgi:hypothetical protein
MADQKKTRNNMPNVKGLAKQAKRSADSTDNKDEQWRIALSSEILAKRGLADQEEEEDAWLEDLKQDSRQFLKHRVGVRLDRMKQESIDKEGIEITVDRLFSRLQGFMYEFNKVAVGTDLHVSATISGDVTEVMRYNKFREAEETRTYFRARFSTSIYSLLIRGKNQTIDFYLLPVNRAMALSMMEDEYKPLATIEIKVDEDGIMWRTVGDGPTYTSLKELCAWLFKELVEQTRLAIVGENREKKGQE